MIANQKTLRIIKLRRSIVPVSPTGAKIGRRRICCVTYNRVLGLGIFSNLSGSETSGLLNAMVGYAFWLALVALVLGIAGFMIRPAGSAGRQRRAKSKN